jgi:prepilin-type N-terminal cleavage/methylation domain-containing protein
MNQSVTSKKWQATRNCSRITRLVTHHSSLITRSAFSLIEVLVVVSLLSLIVFALMTVFNSTQAAFRASVSQTDVLEGGRAAVDLIASDLRQITPSGGTNNGAVNFFSADNNYDPAALGYSPMIQNLPGGSVARTNYLNYFFLLGRENTKWIGIGYAVDATNPAPLYPLYRFYQETNISASPLGLYQNFVNTIYNNQWTNLSHVIDGVVNLVVQPNDNNGYPMTNNYQYNSGQFTLYTNVAFFTLPNRFYFFSNTVPAFVELQLGVLEDRPLQRAGSLPFQSIAQSNYLAQQAGRVHIFRQRVTIPNVDPTAYQ